MDIVFASHTVMGGHFVVGSHHLARTFAASGHRVAHLSTPISPAHLLLFGRSEIIRERYRIWREGGRGGQPGPFNLVPMAPLPWRAAGVAYRLGLNLQLVSTPSIRTLLARCGIGKPDLLIIDQPYFAGLERMLKPRTTLYRATDLYAEMTDDQSNVTAEQDILRNADGWIATSLPVFDHVGRMAPDKPNLLVENGVDVEHFSTPQAFPEDYANIPGPRLVYAGAIDKRFDAKAARELARLMPEVSVVLIGPVADGAGDALAEGGSLPNLHLLGPRPYEKLPAYFQHADVGLILLNDHPANGGRSPMKLYEYAAAGLPVVCRWTHEIARRAEAFIFLYERPDDVAKIATWALDQRDRLESDMRAAAAAASWSAKANRITNFALSLQENGSTAETAAPTSGDMLTMPGATAGK
jgi:glycosyltransferase involved in cell wall biosynthesis